MFTLREFVETHRECTINWIPIDEAQTLPNMYPDLFPPTEHDVNKCIRRMREQNLEHCFLRFYRGKQFSFNNGGPYKNNIYGNCISWNDLVFCSIIADDDLCDVEDLI